MNAVDPVAAYWGIKLGKVRKALEANGFEVSIHDSLEQAAKSAVQEIGLGAKARSVGFGGSKTVMDSGVLDMFKDHPEFELMDARDPKLSPADVVELRRQMLLSDLYLSSTNALTMDGKLINRDRTGNRVGAMHFGPLKVTLMVSRNKICETVEEGVARVKAIASPMNTIRLNMATPCTKAGVCMDCKSPDRICSVWTITEKCWPVGRIHVQLINQDSGF